MMISPNYGSGGGIEWQIRFWQTARPSDRGLIIGEYYTLSAWKREPESLKSLEVTLLSFSRLLKKSFKVFARSDFATNHPINYGIWAFFRNLLEIRLPLTCPPKFLGYSVHCIPNQNPALPRQKRMTSP
jgi:hypothetical protein